MSDKTISCSRVINSCVAGCCYGSNKNTFLSRLKEIKIVNFYFSIVFHWMFFMISMFRFDCVFIATLFVFLFNTSRINSYTTVFTFAFILSSTCVQSIENESCNNQQPPLWFTPLQIVFLRAWRWRGELQLPPMINTRGVHNMRFLSIDKIPSNISEVSILEQRVRTTSRTVIVLFSLFERSALEEVAQRRTNHGCDSKIRTSSMAFTPSCYFSNTINFPFKLASRAAQAPKRRLVWIGEGWRGSFGANVRAGESELCTVLYTVAAVGRKRSCNERSYSLLILWNGDIRKNKHLSTLLNVYSRNDDDTQLWRHTCLTFVHLNIGRSMAC